MSASPRPSRAAEGRVPRPRGDVLARRRARVLRPRGDVLRGDDVRRRLRRCHAPPGRLRRASRSRTRARAPSRTPSTPSSAASSSSARSSTSRSRSASSARVTGLASIERVYSKAEVARAVPALARASNLGAAQLVQAAVDRRRRARGARPTPRARPSRAASPPSSTGCPSCASASRTSAENFTRFVVVAARRRRAHRRRQDHRGLQRPRRARARSCARSRSSTKRASTSRASSRARAARSRGTTSSSRTSSATATTRTSPARWTRLARDLPDGQAPRQLPARRAESYLTLPGSFVSSRPVMAPDMDSVRTLIIGAGVTGLATAARSRERGDDDYLVARGGRARSAATARPSRRTASSGTTRGTSSTSSTPRSRRWLRERMPGQRDPHGREEVVHRVRGRRRSTSPSRRTSTSSRRTSSSTACTTSTSRARAT